MMTIKDFASLCGCNAQTLRYYDKIDLLKPVKVDPWSGYRYYAKSQAIDFVKIKNLQAADFTIDEIKALLSMPDDQVYEAFDRKIAEQTQKLERIREIQRSYLTEITTMKKMIHSFCDHLLEKTSNPEMLFEFGITSGDASRIVDAVRNLMISGTAESAEEHGTITMVVNEKQFEGTQAVENMTFLIKEEELKDTLFLNADHICKDTSELVKNMEPVWEVHGWSFTHEFLNSIPVPEDGAQYVLMVRHHNKPILETLSYPLFLLGFMLLKGHNVHCIVERSDDGQNHFALLRKS